MGWLRFAILFVFISCAELSAQEIVRQSDVMSLRLIPHDLSAASRLMTVYDRDDSSAIDKNEATRLSWRDSAFDFDVDRNGELTHVEVALRQAYLRSLDGIEEADLKLATSFLNRFDQDRNGKIDGAEIDQADFPSDPDEFDADGNGEVTLQELATQFAFERGLRSEMGIVEVDSTRAGIYMSRFDSDKDKSLNVDECAKAPLPRRMEEFDEDGNEKLNLIELSTMCAVHRRKLGLSHFDVKKLLGIFDRHDDDWDGKIQIGPSDEAISDQVPPGAKISLAPGNSAAQQLNKFDANNDRVVTISEVEKHLAKIRERLGYSQVEYQKARKLITRYDSNRSRHLEPNELVAAVEAKQLPRDLFTTADRNKDGKISHEELARHLLTSK